MMSLVQEKNFDFVEYSTGPEYSIKEKGKKRKRQTLEMASEGPQRITGKYYGVYLPS